VDADKGNRTALPLEMPKVRRPILDRTHSRKDKRIRWITPRISMPSQKLRLNRSVGEKTMKITIVGGILIVAAVIAALVVLNASAGNPSFLKFLRKPIRGDRLPGTEPFTPLV
jgi:hypothetical protein